MSISKEISDQAVDWASLSSMIAEGEASGLNTRNLDTILRETKAHLKSRAHRADADAADQGAP